MAHKKHPKRASMWFRMYKTSEYQTRRQTDNALSLFKLKFINFEANNLGYSLSHMFLPAFLLAHFFGAFSCLCRSIFSKHFMNILHISPFIIPRMCGWIKLKSFYCRQVWMRVILGSFCLRGRSEVKCSHF